MASAVVQENRWLVLGDGSPREYVHPDGEHLQEFGPLGRINLFVGANNAGKSRFMRWILRWKFYDVGDKPAYSLVPMGDQKKLIRRATAAVNQLENVFASRFPQDVKRLNVIKDALRAHTGQSEAKEIPTVRHAAARFDALARELGNRESDLIPHLRALAAVPPALEAGPDRPAFPPQRIYIPCLRSAQPLGIDQQGTQRDLLGLAALENLELAGLQVVTVKSGLTLFEDIEKAPNSGYQISDRHTAFCTFLSLRFFNGAPINLFTKSPVEGNPGRRRIEITFRWPGEPEEHPIQNYGDGLNMLIVLLYPAFMAPPGSWIFIEEPENSLHPGLQRAFMQALLEEPALKHHKFFLTTHSNHLLEHTLRCDDLSVFSFRPRSTNRDGKQVREFVVEHVAGHGNHLLADLGVANASVLLANCTIWVEGITDRLYLRTYLRCYQKHLTREAEENGTAPGKRFLEDLHYAFFEFAGSNITHYAFDASDDDAEAQKIRAQFVANRIFLLHDKDSTDGSADGDGKRKERFERLRGEAKTANVSAPGRFVFRTTEGVEIENEIGPALLAEVLQAFLDRMKNPPPVTDAHRAEIAKGGYKTTPLGTYLTSVLGLKLEAATFRGGNKRRRPRTLENEYKQHLADLVAQHATWENMGPRAQALAIAVHEWIARSNP